MAQRNADPADVRAIVAADHADPFRVLGLHAAPDKGRGGGWVIRAFLPQAERAEVVVPGFSTPVPMTLIDDGGFFTARLDGPRPLRYRLRLHAGAHAWEIEDPYRFGPVLGELDNYLIAAGTHLESYRKLGAHMTVMDGVEGVNFAVWAPGARRVSVVGDFNDWDGRRHPMRNHPGCGVWEIFVPAVAEGARYKYELRAADGSLLPLKADPYGFASEHPPSTASVVHRLGRHRWGDAAWMAARAGTEARAKPVSIYEVHLGSWRRVPAEGGRRLDYDELADQLVAYVKDMGFTHIELLPVSEYPFDGSWGYQPIGLYAPTARHGDPDGFKRFVDRCHQEGIGVILDWVAGHFPTDAHGLGRFDGTALYEHEDPRQGMHRDWGTLIYNYGRREVVNYLIANALFWLDEYHIDGLRVDAVASMLYLDYSREEGEWVPNRFGGRENLEAVDFLRRMNECVYAEHPGAITIAEESTAWPMVSRPTYLGGLGFGFKWNMGWMHDTLRYIGHDPIHRKYHHDDLTFGLLYAFHENFVLPISHDEVVHGKGSLLGRMPGDRWQKFANLRAYLCFMFTHPGKKLLFMGCEFGQAWEWNHDASLDWHLLDDPFHAGAQSLVRDLNRLYRDQPALHARDNEPDGFEWIDCHDHEQSVLAYLRRDPVGGGEAVVVSNFTPMVREGYRLGVPAGGRWRVALNTDSDFYGGSNAGTGGMVEAEPVEWHGRPASLPLCLPPLATLVLVREG